MAIFHICTLVTNTQQYDAMKASFIAAGFDEARCRYTVLDNRQENRYDGFGGFNTAMTETTEPYLIYCHQDLLLESGDGFATLMGILQELERSDPRWAVLGNAGWSNLAHVALVITDPVWRDRRIGTLPQRVESLDENFLVLRTAARLRCSEALSGFHLFATDLCLSAQQRGLTCYVIDFHLTHLSCGNKGQDFYDVRRRFVACWSRQFSFKFVRTPSTILFLSRILPLRLLLDSPPMRYVVSRPATQRVLSRLLPSPA